MARIANSLNTLRSQVNAAHPGRSTVSDGWLGDTAHAARKSDHNPGPDGVVEALDITHDPAHGVDTWKMAEILRQNRDRRIDYVISNGRVFVGHHGHWNGKNVGAWTWIKYTGTNSHAQHIHVSVDPSPVIYDDATAWSLTATGPTIAAPAPPKPKGITDDMRQRMMKIIMGYEGKIPPAVFIAPDGRPEISGITQKDHPSKYAQLKGLLDLGLTDKLQAEVIKYYLEYTAPAQNWTDKAGLEFFLRDCILNRGPIGAAEILQMALGLEVDFQIGPTTRGALAALNPNVAIDKLRVARERYEERKYGKQFRMERGQWQGLVSRWNKAQAHAKAFQKEAPSRGAGTAGVIIVGGGAVIANEARELGTSWGDVALQFGALIVIAVAMFLIVRKIREAR